MKRWAAGLVTVIAITVAVVVSVADATGASSPGRRAAQAAAAGALAAVSLPPGAVRSAGNPAPEELGAAAWTPSTVRTVDRHAFWRVPGSPEAVSAWVRSHVPAGASVTATGQSSAPDGRVVRVVQLSFSPVPAAIESSSVTVAVASLGSGHSAVRADGQAVWALTRPRWAVVPAGVGAIEVTVRRLGATAAPPFTITAPSRLHRIVALVNRLPVWQLDGDAVNCPADVGPLVTLAFLRHRGDTDPLAIVTADGSGCGTARLVVRGRAAPTLTGAPRLVAALGIH